MVSPSLEAIRQQIIDDPANKEFSERGWLPVYTAGENARIMIVGQAPGAKAQTSQTPWNDVSGDKLRQWLGVDRDVFYDEQQIALVPMDFYFPGKGRHGDNPPRRAFADKWHPLLRAAMPNLQLIILAGQYSQKYYLAERRQRNLTETVRAYADYLPHFLPLVHPSPLNIRWRARNPWFELEVVPQARRLVHGILQL